MQTSFKGNLFIITAASGAGKSSLIKSLINDYSHLMVSVSHTTRPPRSGEKDGVDYFFVDEVEFHEMVRSGDFLEHAEAHGAFYGTSKSAVLAVMEKGQDLILEIDYQGAFSVREIFEEAISIFILPPSMRALEDRLNSRGKDSKSNIKKRLAVAKHEMSHLDKFDYVIINDDFEKALTDLEAIITSKPEALFLKTKNQITNFQSLIDTLKE
ncbi:MAG: guanylate kinase [Methylophilaceae bacterium]